MADPKYSDEVKTYVAQALAYFDSPAVVAEAVKAEFDVAISSQAVWGIRSQPNGQGKSSRGYSGPPALTHVHLIPVPVTGIQPRRVGGARRRKLYRRCRWRCARSGCSSRRIAHLS
ncbi:DUF2280 domain-containing protein [Sinorhizobium garamanticum]|uniref:DUF2280 domain-containing protein n=1 Tax=Sinorhizobium garamanticum TaxID=680247 RepID=A0ABY8D6J6_9HYPH|nr:DUF2280 domain-containing protein [Sinorhizobium garamanticum]WEX86484.1 DUF2280 domain-containing protein [Sinorhizobium garamanticum]